MIWNKIIKIKDRLLMFYKVRCCLRKNKKKERMDPLKFVSIVKENQTTTQK